MTKPNQVPTSAPGNAPNHLSTSPQNALTVPDYIPSEPADQGDLGDIQIPDIGVAQNTSDCIVSSSDRFIAGAKPSDLITRFAPVSYHDGETGIPIIPVVTLDTWVEFAEGRQGFIARHFQKPTDAITRIVQQDGGKSKMVLTRPTGSILQETKELYCLFEGMPHVVWCWSTRITSLREMITKARLLQHPAGGSMPLYARKYLLRTVAKKNSVGRWWGIRFDPLDYVSKPEYEAAIALRDFIRQGSFRTAPPSIE
jgi:hypothetical protein